LAVADGGTGASDSNAWLNSRITTNADGSLNYDATGATAVNHDSLTGFASNEHFTQANITATGALDSGSITENFGAIDNGTSGIRTNTFTAETSIIPDASGGADIGSTSAEWGDVFIADDKKIKFGNDQDFTIEYDEDGSDIAQFAGADIGMDGNYIVNEQGRQDHVANTMPAPHYRFDGSNDVITVGDSTHLDSGSGNYSVEMLVKFLPDALSNTYAYLSGRYEDSNNHEFFLWDAGVLKFKIKDATTDIYNSAATWITPTVDTWYHIVWVGTYNTSNLWYVDGKAYASDGVDTVNTGTVDFTADYTIGKYNTDCANIEIAFVRRHNLALSATEVKELYSGASVPYKYKGANQTALAFDSGADVFTSGTYGWVAYGNNSIANVSNALEITFEDEGSAYGAYRYLDAARALASDMTVGKSYRFSCDAKFDGGNAGVVVEVYGGSTYYQTSAIPETTAANISVEFIVAPGSPFVRLSGMVASNVVTLDNLKIVQIGAVAEYDGSGVGASRWDDKSGNELHGTVSGATVENAPADADSGLTYEEGSYTATISESGGQTPTSTAGSSKLSYTKIGRLVTVVGTIQIDNIDSGSGALQIGLPFTSKANDVGTGYHASYVGTYDVDILGDGEAVFAQIAPSTAYTSLAAVRDGATSVAQIATGFYRLQIQYEV